MYNITLSVFLTAFIFLAMKITPSLHLWCYSWWKSNICLKHLNIFYFRLYLPQKCSRSYVDASRALVIQRLIIQVPCGEFHNRNNCIWSLVEQLWVMHMNSRKGKSLTFLIKLMISYDTRIILYSIFLFRFLPFRGLQQKIYSLIYISICQKFNIYNNSYFMHILFIRLIGYIWGFKIVNFLKFTVIISMILAEVMYKF